MLLEILVEIHVVGSDHDGATRRAHAYVLRREGVPPTRVDSDPVDDLYIVAIYQVHSMIHIEFHERQDVVGFYTPMLFHLTARPGLCNKHTRPFESKSLRLETGPAVSVIPVHVRNDDVSDVCS